MNIQLALQILQLANQHDESGEDTVARAKAYMDFVRSRGGAEEEPVEIPGGPSLEPTPRRKRRTKAEMQQQETAITAENSALVNADPIPEFLRREPLKYEDVQNAVLAVFDEPGPKPIFDALQHFNAKTVSDLKQENYAEFMDILLKNNPHAEQL